MTWQLAVCLAVLVALTSPAFAQSRLDTQLTALINSHDGKAAVMVKHLETGESFASHETEPMPTASLIKFPVMVEAYRQAAEGKLKLDQLVSMKEEDKVPGSGILTINFSAGASLTLRDAIRLMIAYSDNTATNLVVDQIGLPSTAETMESLGFPNTKLHAKVFRRETSIFPERSKEFGLGSTTAADMINLLELLYEKKLVNEQASEEMLAHLLACEDEAKFPKRLPPGTKIAHKTGSVTAVRTDAGIIFTSAGPIAVCVLTSENKERGGDPENIGDKFCAEVAKIVFEHFVPADQRTQSTDELVLQVGAAGDLVEALQRTLNARLAPATNVSVDGDFGPETEGAVIKFQQANNLLATGIVGPETWKALGTLLTDDEPVSDPELANAETLPLAPADKLTGPPLVTCKAWAIGDGKTGELLWGDHETDRLDFASTTKIMTAYIVVKLAAADPNVLDEEITFSQRADATEGSSTGIRAGEKIAVRELLYGLMLPSGNDASVALAEHFGMRFDPPAGQDASANGYTRFVAEMNRTAKHLEMLDTNFANPHGLPDAAHLSSTRDLLRLGWQALQSPLMQQYVQARQHGCTVTGAAGYQRNIVWKNSNKLLEIEGYSGLKTGTTTSAGACLVSCGTRGDDSLIVVVLGSTSSDARYTDTRNLYRWAWTQRGLQD